LTALPSSILLTYCVYVSLFILLNSSSFLLFFIFNPSFPTSLFSSLIQMLPHFPSSFAIALLLSSCMSSIYSVTQFYFYCTLFWSLLLLLLLSATINRHHPPISRLIPWLIYRPKPNLGFSCIRNHFPWWAYSPAMKMGTADFSRLLSKQPTSTWHHHPTAHHASFNHQKINMS